MCQPLLRTQSNRIGWQDSLGRTPRQKLF
uniref:Uncharacterized protein n=1 Tax=Rhizophora mucronata TaxID=61149 RepID=A0A2P2QEZ8_RHIMU